MTALTMEDIKAFTHSLFVGDTFDHFLVRTAEIVTFNSFLIEGQIKQGYFTEEELEGKKIGKLSSWSVLKPICFSLIKGKKLPGSFHIVLSLSPDDAEQLLTRRQIPMQSEQVSGLYLNIRYADSALLCITGTSVNLFTMDKTLDREWDEEIRQFFRKAGLAFLEE